MNNITYKQFSALSEEGQISVLIEEGVSIAESKQPGQLSFLYFLKTFFVVVIFNPETDELVKIIALSKKEKKKNVMAPGSFYCSN